jgi:hypothetical protein
LSKTTTELGTCQVRSGTDRPCTRPAVVRIRGVPFCKPCAREQEAYFAVGELTEASKGLPDEPLVKLLGQMRRTTRRHGVRTNEPDAA